MATIITKNSATAGNTPSNLTQGELAINVTDGNLYYGSGSGNVVKQFNTIPTASYALYAVSASYEINTETSSSYADTASYLNPGTYFITASWATNAITANTASYILNAVSSSFAISSSIAGTAQGALSADTAKAVLTVVNATNADFYPTFVDSNNSPTAASEIVYTSNRITFNPSTQLLAVPRISSTAITASAFTGSLTGSLLGTASYAVQALSASWAPGGGSAFPYIGTAVITGSLIVSGANGGINTSLGFPALFQNDGVNTVVFGNGKLWLNDSVGGTSVDWGNRYLLDSDGTTTVDWENGLFNDQGGNSSIDANSRVLYDSAGTMAFDWESRRMIDVAGARSADFDTRFLIYPNGTTAAINYGTQGQIAMTGSVTITGSLTVSGSSTFTNIGPAIFSGSVSSLNGFTGSLQGTASYATVAQTLLGLVTSASYAVTASYSLGPIKTIQDVADGTAVTGTTSGTLTKSILIPANTVGVGDVLYIKARARKTGTAGTLVVRMYINTSAAIGGSLIATSATNAATTVYHQYARTAVVKTTTNTETMAGNFNVNADDNIVSSTTVSANNIDWTVAQYLVIAHTNASAADSSVNSFGHIQINKA